MVHPTALESQEFGTFEAPEIPNADVPALLGLRSLDAMGTLIDVKNKRLFRVGPGGYNISL
eukprot:13332304-Heterocapsa_arctica.AAC.1